MKRLSILIVIVLTSLSLTAQVGRELYRPAFHYSPGFNWMNDPNGLVFYNGKYHLFYQHNPLGVQLANFSWGHAVSTDLINWEEKPVAIPAQDNIMIYSGSVVVDWNNTSGFGINGKPPLVAIYTGKSSVEDQRIAYSNDEGMTWTNYPGNPVLSMNNNQFRDPKVIWHEPTQKWIMSVSQGSYQGIRFYGSPDLKNWTLLSGFGGAGNRAGFWECPDLFNLPLDNDSANKKWVLVHSVSPTGQYFVGDFNGEKFLWENQGPGGILIDDFEDSRYNNWTVTGNSFGQSPSDGTGTYSGYLGSKLLRSSVHGMGAVGKMHSANFIIQKKYISFLISGGYDPQNLLIKLVIDGNVMRSATGMYEDIMKWRTWDVSSYVGSHAHIEIVDSATHSWGRINIDHIIQSDETGDYVNHGQLDYGKDFYAVQSFSDIPDGRRIWMAWMNNWNYATGVPTSPWKGVMTIPREVNLETRNGQIKLIQRPIPELVNMRKNGLTFNNKELEKISSTLNIGGANNLLTNSSYKQFELKAKLAVSNHTGFILRLKKRGLQYTEYTFDFVNREIRFDRSRSGGLTGDQYYKSLQFAPLIVENGYFDLHLFVDNCSAELFTANGEVVMTNQIFPDSASNRIELISMGDDIVFQKFEIWRLDKNAITPGPTPVNDPMFHVYPNPVINSNGITIKIREDKVGILKFRLFDTQGNLITEFQPSSSSLLLPRNKLAYSSGLFLLSATDGSSVQTQKLVVVSQ